MGNDQPRVTTRSGSAGSDEDSDREYFDQKPAAEVDASLDELYDHGMKQFSAPADPPDSSTVEALSSSIAKISLEEGQYLGIVFDTRMARHRGLPAHPERPDRIRAIAKRLAEQGLLQHCIRIPARPATEAERLLAHDPAMLAKVNEAYALLEGSEDSVAFIDNDTYLSVHSLMAAELAVGSLIDATTAAVKGHVKHAFANIRPPGHHAESKEAMGFCIWDNVAIAAEHAFRSLGLQRIAVVDWDIHHGNGIQEIFNSRSDLLYISLHRHPFYPGTGASSKLGVAAGEGYSVNVPWPRSGFGDPDYQAAFNEVVLPVLGEFQPQLILVASGFDAALGDPLGSTRVTPPCYHWMTQQLLQYKVPVVVALEGGYNLKSISLSAEAVVRALLDLPPPDQYPDHPTPELQPETPELIQELKGLLSPFWSTFNSK